MTCFRAFKVLGVLVGVVGFLGLGAWWGGKPV